MHPFNQQKDLVDFCLGCSVFTVTNEPTGKGLRSKNKTLKGIAEKLEISPEQVAPSDVEIFNFNIDYIN